jgi:tetratricopeptide (TPR) repeat protein
MAWLQHLRRLTLWRYNRGVYVRRAVTVVVLSAGLLAQSAPPSCPAERPVDDIITEIHKQQSNKKHRNSNPLPDVICIGGWCRGHSSKQKPPTSPESARPDSAPPAKNPGEDESTSSSRVPVDECNDAMEMALEAAHNVEVGDFSFAANNYDGALLRYKDAVQEKPGDAAIHVRLGRVLERLGQLPQAMEQYKAAQELAGPAKWSDEAKAAVLRLQHRQPSGKD